MKISFVTTLYNETITVDDFIKSINIQTILSSEIIVVDGGSIDNTVEQINKLAVHIKNIKVIVKKGNRSVGRNEAIKHATGDIIVCSDAGNILDKDWIKNITEPFMDSRISENDHISSKLRGTSKDSITEVDVVAGYYKGIAKNAFQKCLIPYVLVMPDKVNPNTFLPATRSIAFTKKIWEKVGGFDEKLSHNEDYAFAHALKKAGASIVFKKDAIVYWIPRNTFNEAFIMFFRFAYGDAEARIWRPKVIFLFTRYVFGLLLLLYGIWGREKILLYILLVAFLFYLIWSIQKNYTYVKRVEAIYYLPSLQLTSDLAVISGTLLGIIRYGI